MTPGLMKQHRDDRSRDDGHVVGRSCHQRYMPRERGLLQGRSLKVGRFGGASQLKPRHVDLPTDGKPLGVTVDAELDRFSGFVRIGFCFGIHRLSGWRIPPPPDNPMPSSS
jgi:hypothetical protein